MTENESLSNLKSLATEQPLGAAGVGVGSTSETARVTLRAIHVNHMIHRQILHSEYVWHIQLPTPKIERKLHKN